MLQEPALALQSAAVAGERAICSDHAMAGDDDADGVGAVRETNGSDGVGPVDLAGQLSIRDRGALGDLPQFLPDAALEFRAARLGWDLVDRIDIAREVAIHFVAEAMRIDYRIEYKSVLSVMQS